MDKAKIICEFNDKKNDYDLEVYVLDEFTSEFIKSAEDGFGKINGTRIIPETDGKNEQHAGVMNAFAAHILRGEPLTAEGAEGINGLTISNAAFLSSWLDKTVDIPFDEDLYWELLQKKIAGSEKKAAVNDTVKGDMSSTF